MLHGICLLDVVNEGQSSGVSAELDGADLQRYIAARQKISDAFWCTVTIGVLVALFVCFA